MDRVFLMPRSMAFIGHDSLAMSQHHTHVGRDVLEKATRERDQMKPVGK